MSQRRINSLIKNADLIFSNLRSTPAGSRRVKPVILVGGKSSRFGEDKVNLNINGELILEGTYRVLKDVFGVEPLFVGRKALPTYYHVIPDEIVGAGPMGGLYTALNHTTENFVFLSACDMPFINEKVLKYMFDNLQDDSLIYLPRFKNGMIEPIFAFYNKKLLPCVSNKIKEGDFRLRSLLSCGKAQYLKESEIESLDPEFLSFFNINTKDDFDKVKKWCTVERDKNSKI